MVNWKNCRIFAADLNDTSKKVVRNTLLFEKISDIWNRNIFSLKTNLFTDKNKKNAKIFGCLKKPPYLCSGFQKWSPQNEFFDVLIDYKKIWNGWEYLSTIRYTCSTLWNAFGFVNIKHREPYSRINACGEFNNSLKQEIKTNIQLDFYIRFVLLLLYIL